MNISDLTYIPRRIRRVLVFILTVTTVVSIGLFGYFAFLSPRDGIAEVALSASQTSLAGLVLVILVTYSLRMKGADEMQSLIDDFFVRDLHKALRFVHVDPGEMRAPENPRRLLRRKTELTGRTKIMTDFRRGMNAASYELTGPGGEQQDLYIKASGRHIVVKYFFDPEAFDPANDEAEFKSVFKVTIDGAISVGYTYEIIRRFHASREEDVLELTLYWTLDDEFFLDPGMRLFIRNDLRTMTSSVLHSLRAHRRAG